MTKETCSTTDPTVICNMYCGPEEINLSECDFISDENTESTPRGDDVEYNPVSKTIKALNITDFDFNSEITGDAKKLLMKIKECFLTNSELIESIDCFIYKKNDTLETCCFVDLKNQTILRAPVKGIWKDDYFDDFNFDKPTVKPTFLEDHLTSKVVNFVEFYTNIYENLTTNFYSNLYKNFTNHKKFTEHPTISYINDFITKLQNYSEPENTTNIITESPSINNYLSNPPKNNSLFDSNRDSKNSNYSIIVVIFGIGIFIFCVLGILFLYRKVRRLIRNRRGGDDGIPLMEDYEL